MTEKAGSWGLGATSAALSIAFIMALLVYLRPGLCSQPHLRALGPGQGPLQLLPATLPVGFDWEAYRFYNPDISPSITQQNASKHYLSVGRFEGRLFRSVPLTLRYVPVGGLCNQIYGLLNVLTLAVQLKAVVVVPPALSRATFAQSKGYSPVQADTLLDLDAMGQYFAARGVAIHKHPFDEPTDIGALRTDCLVIENSEAFKRRSLQNAIAKVLAQLRSGVKPVLLGDPRHIDHLCLHLDLGMAYYTLHGGRSLPQITDAARGVSFAPEVVAVAAAVVKSIEGPFMGVHLRIEGDWKNVKQRPLSAWIKLMKAAGFNASSTLYVASGVFSYQSDAEIEALKAELKAGGVYGRLVHKEMLMPEGIQQGMNSEQLALIDLLVLAEAEAVVGDCQSSFSAFLRELRALRGRPKASASFVGKKRCRDPSDPPEDPYRSFQGAWVLSGEPWPDEEGNGVGEGKGAGSSESAAGGGNGDSDVT